GEAREPEPAPEVMPRDWESILSELLRLGVASQRLNPAGRVTLPTRAADPLVLRDDPRQWSVAAHPLIREEQHVDLTGGVEALEGLQHLRLGDVSWVMGGRPGGVEDFARLPSPTSALSEQVGSEVVLRYSLKLEGVAGLRLVHSTLEFLDEAGTPRWRMQAPYAVDASGVKWPLSLALENCHADTADAPPWRRAVTPPGADLCVVRLSFAAAAQFPVWVDPQWVLTDELAFARSRFSWRYPGYREIKVFGGLDAAGMPLDSIEAFDQQTQTWSLAGSLPTARGAHQALEVGEWLYLFGGAANVERGKPTEAIWEDRGTPQNTQGCATLLTIIGAKLPVYIGASDPNATTARVEYESSAGGWQVAQAPQPVSFRVGAQCRVINTSGTYGILYFGGREASGAQPTDTWILRADPTLTPAEELARIVWEPGPDLGVAFPGGFFNGGSSGDWLVGGEAGGVPLDQTARIVENVDEVHFEAGPPLPRALTRPSVIHTPDVALITGGQRADGSYSGATYRYTGSAWQDELFLRVPRADAGLVALVDWLGPSEGPAGFAAIGGEGDVGTLASTELMGGELALPCSKDSECGSGFCSQGVCCESRCDGDCETCAYTPSGGATGTCHPVPRGERTPQGCVLAHEPCATSTLCDGHGKCLPAAAGAACASGCDDGAMVSGSCDGEGYCLVSRVECPGTCVNGLCSYRCTTDSDCSADYQCKDGECAPASCADCGYYACDALTQRCKTSCDANSDCDFRRCDTVNHTCTGFWPTEPVSAGCLCEFHSSSAPHSPALLSLVVCAGLGWRRRQLRRIRR
ncbi:MAG: hypothetical protein AB7S68_16995, partial [Polyangiaceae bacterium]